MLTDIRRLGLFDCRIHVVQCTQTTAVNDSTFGSNLSLGVLSMLLENDAFLCELTKLFTKGKTTGSVTMTMKRYDGWTKPKPRNGDFLEPNEYKCLVRATLGNKKIATVINHKDVTKFQMAYGNLMKANMDGLKKKDKKAARGRKKAKATQ